MHRPLLAAALACLTACGGGSEPTPPDVVLIVVDTLRADHADSALGRASTPVIDGLADDGVRFGRAFAHAPSTLPSHVSLFASRHPFEAGVKLNAQTVPEMPLLAGWLARFGYRNAAVVSLSSLWPFAQGTGLERGFARYVYDGQVDCWPAERVNAELEPLLDELDRGDEPFFLFAHYSDPHDPYNAHGSVERTVDLAVDGVHVDTILASEFGFRRGVVTLSPGPHTVELTSDDPFLVRLVEPRSPQGLLPLEWEQGAPWQEQRSARLRVENPGEVDVECDLWMMVADALSPEEVRARYRLEVEHVDRHIGLLLDSLERRGLYDDALIVLVSDHGEALGEHGHVGHVVNLYDEQLHVPLIVKPPAGHASRAALVAARSRVVRLVDLVPTVLDVLALPPMPGQRGASLLGPQSPQPLLAETHAPMAPRTLFALRDVRRKLVHAPAQGQFEMYDLAGDPDELLDVFGLRGRELDDWQRELRAIAEASASVGTAEPILDPEVVRRLQGLGY